MKDYFISKIHGLKFLIQPTEKDPLFYLRRLMSNKSARLTFRPVSPEEVRFIVKV